MQIDVRFVYRLQNFKALQKLQLYVNGELVLRGNDREIMKRILSEVQEHKKQMHFYEKSKIRALECEIESKYLPAKEKLRIEIELKKLKGARNFLIAAFEPCDTPKHLKIEILPCTP